MVRKAIRVAAVLVVAAIASALAWTFVHPSITSTVDNGEVIYANDSQTWVFGNDGWFAVITVAVGLLLSLGFLRSAGSRSLGLGGLIGVAVVMLAYAAATWQLGIVVDAWVHHPVSTFPPASLAAGEIAVAPLKLRAYGVLLLPSLTWVVAAMIDALIGVRSRARR